MSNTILSRNFTQNDIDFIRSNYKSIRIILVTFFKVKELSRGWDVTYLEKDHLISFYLKGGHNRIVHLLSINTSNKYNYYSWMLGSSKYRGLDKLKCYIEEKNTELFNVDFINNIRNFKLNQLV